MCCTGEILQIILVRTAFTKKSFQVDGDPFRNESVLLSRVLQRCSDGWGEGSASASDAFFCFKKHTGFPHYPTQYNSKDNEGQVQIEFSESGQGMIAFKCLTSNSTHFF